MAEARRTRASDRNGPGAMTSGPGGWRPGARWAQGEVGSAAWLERRIATKHAHKAELEARIATLPLHQRPAMRELGRRSEAAPVPYRAMPADEVGGRLDQACPPVPDPHEVEALVARLGLGNDRRERLAREGFGPGGEGAGSAGPRHAEAAAKGVLPGTYDLTGAFWHTGRTLGGTVRRATDARKPEPLSPPAPAPLAPLVTAEKIGSRTLVAAACPAARALGLHPDQTVSLARASVPGLDIRPADRAGDRTLLLRLARLAARRWTPVAAPCGEDGLWLDLTGVAHLHGGEARFCRRLLRFLRRRGYSGRIAVADTAGAAHALARHVPGPVTLCPPGGHEAAMASLPVAALRLDGDDPDRLRRLGLDRIGDLLALPRAPLARRFGAALVRRLDQATGRAPEPLVPVALPQVPRANRRLLEPIGTAEAIAQVVGDLSADLCLALTARGLGVRRLSLTCRRVDGVDQTLAIGTARANRDPAHLARLIGRRIETIEPGFGIEAMALAAWRTEPFGAKAFAGALAGDAETPDLAPLVDQLAGRLGERGLYRLAAVESDVPERSVTRLGPLDEGGAGWPPHWPRPARLLVPPEALAHVLAELPDQPPRRFTWRGQVHSVVAGDGPERIHGEWWRRAGEADAVRDYFRVEDEAGRRFWLFRRGDGVDGRTGDLSWHLHGLFG